MHKRRCWNLEITWPSFYSLSPPARPVFLHIPYQESWQPKEPFGIILSPLQGFNYSSELFHSVHFLRDILTLKKGLNACRTLCPWKYVCYVVHASILTSGPFVFGVDTSLNAETVNHWARVTAVTLPIHAITEIAEHTLRMYNLHIHYPFCKLCFFFLLPFTLLHNSN